jgi:membrane-bound metal-dependent hydrolase YbcI (DUF457 family)
MVMGPTHAMSGAAAGAVVAVATAHLNGEPVSLPAAGVLIGVTAGAAILPDLDHPSGTAARVLGPVSRVFAVFINRASSMLAELTGAKGRNVGGHRTVTHTLVFAVALAAATWAAVEVGEQALTIALFASLVLLALHSLARPLARQWGAVGSVVVAAGVTVLIARDMPDMLSAPVMATAVGVGCVTHCVGDAVTKSGVPLFAPLIPVGGDRWGAVHLLPPPVRIRASGPGDSLVMLFCIAALVFVLVQGWNRGLIVS